MDFKIYMCKRFLNLYPLVILTSGNQNKSILYSEYFILIRENNETHFFPLRIVKHTSDKDLESLGINEKFMMNQACNSAKDKLDDFFMKKIESQKETKFLYQGPELMECNEFELMASFLHGEFDKDIFIKINIQTNSRDLGDYINKITQLSVFQKFYKF